MTRREILVRETAHVMDFLGLRQEAARLDVLVGASFDGTAFRRIGAPLSRRERRVAGRAVRLARRLLERVGESERNVLTGYAPGQAHWAGERFRREMRRDSGL